MSLPGAVEPRSEELALLRRDPLLWEQELDVRPGVAEDLERALGKRSGETFWRSRHDHLYCVELADLGRGRPGMARVFGWWDRYEPRPPEHEIDADLVDFCLWVAEAARDMEPEDVRKVFQFAGVPPGWPEGSVLRTPDERFADLPDFPWEPRYVTIEGLRMAWVEAGDPEAEECFLLLHGEPTWSFLYRRMIPALARAGRVVAPDLVGFGRSDKPAMPHAYTYRSHARWLRRFVEALDLRGVTQVSQDWGGLLGMRLLARQPERHRRLVVMNTGFPDGTAAPSEAFLAWRRFSQRTAELDVARLLRGSLRRRELTDAEAAAYAAPFPSRRHQTAARVFPRLVPIHPEHPGALENREAREILAGLDLPVLPVWSDQDPVTGPWEEPVRSLFRHVEDTVRIAGAGHFIQEDAGEEVAAAILDWIGRP